MMLHDRKNQFKSGMLWSLLELQEIYFSPLGESIHLLSQLRIAALGEKSGSFDPDLVEHIKDNLKNLCIELDKLGFEMTKISAVRMSEKLSKRSDVKEYYGDLTEIFQRFRDQINGKKFYYLTAQEAAYIGILDDPQWSLILEKIPSIIQDIDSAGRCFAFGNYTASVFHLMRSMEIMVKICGKKLGATIETKKDGKPLTWLQITEQFEHKINQIPNHSDKLTWKTVSMNLQIVGQACRNETMHPKNHYDEREAANLFEACRGFIEKIIPKI